MPCCPTPVFIGVHTCGIECEADAGGGKNGTNAEKKLDADNSVLAPQEREDQSIMRKSAGSKSRAR